MRIVVTALILGAALLGTAACPLPLPQGKQDVDAGVNAPPIILSATPEDLAFPGPVILDPNDARRVTLRVVDNDITDVLHVRFYRDYTANNPTPPVNSATALAGLESQRLIESSVVTWCAGIDETVPTSHILEVVVADDDFLPNDQPPLFRALPEGAFGATRSWDIVCNPNE